LPELTKIEITNRVGRRYGYRSLLEISCTSTGFTRGGFDTDQFTCYQRLVYRCGNDFDDGAPIAFRTDAESSHEVTERLLSERAPANLYDVVFVDPFHTYENSMTDLVGAFALVRPGGAIVVHDCHPTDPQIVSPVFQLGIWCGVTYWAFIDFVLGRAGIEYFTVDADYGCGVIRKTCRRSGGHDIALEFAWKITARLDERRYAFFREREVDLLRLISARRFRERYRHRKVRVPVIL
jgi:hypothetical protein